MKLALFSALPLITLYPVLRGVPLSSPWSRLLLVSLVLVPSGRVDAAWWELVVVVSHLFLFLAYSRPTGFFALDWRTWARCLLAHALILCAYVLRLESPS